MDDSALLAKCVARGYQGSGPGGQHRNKTNSGVELTLDFHNLEIRCCEDRSGQVNRLLALHRLRIKIALEVRCPPLPFPPFAFPGSNGRIQVSNVLFARFWADVLDRIEALDGAIPPAAAAWGLSSSALVRIAFQEKAIIDNLQKMRVRHGKALLKQ